MFEGIVPLTKRTPVCNISRNLEESVLCFDKKKSYVRESYHQLIKKKTITPTHLSLIQYNVPIK